MIGLLGWFANSLEDAIAKGCMLLVAAALGFVGLQMQGMTAQLTLARADLTKHTEGMYVRMEPMVRVANALAAPEGRDGKMRLFVYLDKVDKFESMHEEVAEIKASVGRIEGKVDRLLPAAVAKGRP